MRMDTTWQQLIVGIKARGFTLADIATTTGSKVSTIGDIATGRTEEPKYALALELLRMSKSRKTQRSA